MKVAYSYQTGHRWSRYVLGAPLRMAENGGLQVGRLPWMKTLQPDVANPDILPLSSSNPIHHGITPRSAFMVFRVLLILIWLLPVSTLTQAAEAVNDVRILIDTSGSMKKTDPKNLRVPALKLLVNLLPPESKTGVWLFDTTASRLISPEKVTPASRNAILDVAGKIHSRGLFTDIEAALRAASEDWSQQPATDEKRTIILLTDGMVDLPTGTEASAASRQRILSEWLPRLQASGVTIHTIGLSGQSDRSLLQQISLATTGSAEIAQDAQALQRNFVRIFNRVVPKPTLPIKDNQFAVDASIEEMTVLIFLKPNAGTSHLISPSGHKIGETQKPEGTRWVHESGYDLVTVDHPETGMWSLDADVDPGNQVMVVTRLKMEVTPIPAQLMRGELSDITASFSENGRLIERKDFLDLINVASQITEGDLALDNPVIREEGRPTHFQVRFTAQPDAGQHTLTITADGKTFQRQSVQDFTLLEDWVTVQQTEDLENDPPRWLISLSPASNALMPDSLAAHARLSDQNGQNRELEPDHHNGNVIFTVPLPGPDDHWIINLTATAKKPDGSKLDIPLKPVRIDGKPLIQPPAESPPLPVSSPPPEQASPHESAPEPVSPAAAPAPSAEDDVDFSSRLKSILDQANWVITLAITLGINIMIAGLWFWAYRTMKKRHEVVIANLISKLNPSTIPNT